MKYHSLIFNVAPRRGLLRTLGVYRIAHILRENNWDVEVADFILFWQLGELITFAKSRITKDTKFIGFSHLFSDWNYILETFTIWLKKEYPHLVLISGSGSNPFFESNTIDYYIQGYGEVAILELLKYLFSNGTRPKFNANLFNKKIIPANQFYPAFPSKSLMVKYEDRDFIEPNEWLGIEFARGCIFNCAYCNFPVLGVKEDYTRDALDAEIQLRDAYDRFGITNYIVSDETFNDRSDKITKFADAVEQLNFNPFFSGFLRADLLVTRPNDKEELSRMNFLGHFYGVETFNRRTGQLVGKGMDPTKLKEGLIDIRNYFENNNRKIFRGTVAIIVGLPEETIETMNSTIDWLVDNWQGQSVNMFSFEIPNHELDKKSKISLDHAKYGYTEMTQEERDQYNELHRWSFLQGMHSTMIWKNPHMNIYEADLIVRKFRKLEAQQDFRLNCFSLGEYEMSDDPIEKIILKRKEDIRAIVPESETYNFAKPYIAKKLNQ